MVWLPGRVQRYVIFIGVCNFWLNMGVPIYMKGRAVEVWEILPKFGWWEWVREAASNIADGFLSFKKAIYEKFFLSIGFYGCLSFCHCAG